MSKQVSHQTQYRRLMLRSDFQSLFWHVILVRKRELKFTLKALADKLGINRSYVTRSFSSPPNWTVDKLSDMADALGVDLVVEARDRANGRNYSSCGTPVPAQTTTCLNFEDHAAPDFKITAGPGLKIDDEAYQVSVTA